MKPFTAMKLVIGIFMGIMLSFMVTVALIPPEIPEVTPPIETFAEVRMEVEQAGSRIEKMRYQLQAIHKRLVTPTLDTETTK